MCLGQYQNVEAVVIMGKRTYEADITNSRSIASSQITNDAKANPAS
jgi:hypothetical protein